MSMESNGEQRKNQDRNIESIPVFPNFKKIEPSDRSSVESITRLHPPYSDFNFTNLWMWDTTEKRKISMLNGNLAVLFTDDVTCEPFLSFLGSTRCAETAHTLLDFAEASRVMPKLRLIAEESLPQLRAAAFDIEEDPDNFDYVYEISRLANPIGRRLKEKHYLAKRFFREYPDVRFESFDLGESTKDKGIMSVLRRWENRKKLANKAYDIEHEEQAIDRLLRKARILAQNTTLILSAVFLKEEMLGFSVDEIAPRGYATSHFIKADSAYKGIYEFINEKVAGYLAAKNVKFWNWEEDLGIKGLREMKKDYAPVHFLKKYTVSRISGA